MNGFKYTIEEVEDAVKTLNEHHGLPVEGGVTQFTIDSFIEFEGDYCIEFSEWTEILGEPIEITIE
jgi:hypothetical protein